MSFTVLRLLLLATAVSAVSCGTKPAPSVNERPVGAAIKITPPLGLPPVPVPADNPITVETVALGRRLFYDPVLSADNTVACATCHNPQFGFTDGRKTSRGINGLTGNRSAPPVLNAAYSKLQFWDGRAATLEDQAAGPIANPIEMNMQHDLCVTKLSADPSYVAAFDRAFGPGPITIGKVQKAVAAFERTVLSGDSPFDRYQYGGDKSAMRPEAVRGLAVFLSPERGNCAACHLVGPQYALFTDGLFHNLGTGMGPDGELTDMGRYHQTKAEADRGSFKTPTLRNIAQTGPYMHDGRLKTLREVVDFYVGGGSSNPSLDPLIRPLELTGQERQDLVAFLESLTGTVPPETGPPPKEPKL